MDGDLINSVLIRLGCFAPHSLKSGSISPSGVTHDDRVVLGLTIGQGHSASDYRGRPLTH